MDFELICEDKDVTGAALRELVNHGKKHKLEKFEVATLSVFFDQSSEKKKYALCSTCTIVVSASWCPKAVQGALDSRLRLGDCRVQAQEETAAAVLPGRH